MVKIRVPILFIVFIALSASAWSAESDDLPPLPKGPLVLTSVTQEQLSPDYWIHQIADGDIPIKTPQELAHFNEEIHQMIPESKDIFKLDPARAGAPIRDQISLEFNAVRGRSLYTVEDTVIPKSFFDHEIKPLLQLEKIPAEIKMKWGVATRATSVRALPHDIKLLEKLKDYEFDMLQFTLIKLWTPVGIYHTSSDGEWVYLQAPYARGWVKARDIALFSTLGDMKNVAASERFLAVTGDSIPIFKDAALQTLDQKASMGTRIPLLDRGIGSYRVWLPKRNSAGKVILQKAYIDLKSDVSVGFPPFTQANVIRQAFKLLGARYGWGGMYDGRDCSGFTHDVFLSLGVAMPRDSKYQGFIGTPLGHFKPFEQADLKIDTLKAATPGLTLLRMSKHQMLYLGQANGHFYVIHSTWAERISLLSDEKNRINQVVVSDLTLNGKSYLGSLFDRTLSINEIN